VGGGGEVSSNNGVTLTAPVAGGKLDLSPAQKETVARYLATRDGKAVVLKLARPVSSRSQRQNAFYWGVVLTTIAESTGNTTEDLHEHFKGQFLPRRFVTLAGKEMEVAKTTTALSVEEFSRYLEQLAAFAATELGITLPDRP
jgi:hypothetical protein